MLKTEPRKFEFLVRIEIVAFCKSQQIITTVFNSETRVKQMNSNINLPENNSYIFGKMHYY